MADSNSEFLEKLASIKASYVKEGLPQQLQVVCDCQAQLETVSDSDAAINTITALHAAAHKLAGSSGTFGFNDLSVAARALSDFTGNNGPINAENYSGHLQEIYELAERVKNVPID